MAFVRSFTSSLTAKPTNKCHCTRQGLEYKSSNCTSNYTYRFNNFAPRVRKFLTLNGAPHAKILGKTILVPSDRKHKTDMAPVILDTEKRIRRGILSRISIGWLIARHRGTIRRQKGRLLIPRRFNKSWILWLADPIDWMWWQVRPGACGVIQVPAVIPLGWKSRIKLNGPTACEPIKGSLV